MEGGQDPERVPDSGRAGFCEGRTVSCVLVREGLSELEGVLKLHPAAQYYFELEVGGGVSATVRSGLQ